jgi:hypothetical protein
MPRASAIIKATYSTSVHSKTPCAFYLLMLFERCFPEDLTSFSKQLEQFISYTPNAYLMQNKALFLVRANLLNAWTDISLLHIP